MNTRDLKFDLNVESNALFQPNPTEFYTKAYISEDIAGNFRVIPNVKNATKVSNVLFGDLLQPFNCSFTNETADLGAVDVPVCSLAALAQICQADLESSWLSAQMTQGSNGDWGLQSFLSYYWDTMSKQIGEELATLRWQGDTNLPSSPATYLQHCDGYLVQLDNDNEVIGVTAAGSVTAGNVLAEIGKVYDALPAAIKFKTNDLRIFMSPDIAGLYLASAALGNTQTYITAQLPLTYLGIPVVVQEGMPAKTMVATLSTNLIYAVDAINDSTALKAVYLADTIAEPLMRTRVNLKAGFAYVNPTEIVYYS